MPEILLSASTTLEVNTESFREAGLNEETINSVISDKMNYMFEGIACYQSSSLAPRLLEIRKTKPCTVEIQITNSAIFLISKIQWALNDALNNALMRQEEREGNDHKKTD